MPRTDAQRRAELNYRKSKVRTFAVKLSPVDQNMIEWLESKDNIQGYLKELIRADMET